MYRSLILLALLSGAAAASGAVHEAVPADLVREVPARFLGFDYKVYRTNYVHDAAWRQAVQELRPALLRYPGGNHANFWDWRAGRPTDLLVRQRAPGTVFEPHTLDDQAQLLADTGAEPVWSLNILTSTLEEQVEWLRAIRARGLPIHRVELGNELFFNEATSRDQFPNGRGYGRKATEWMRALRREFPGVRCGVPLWAPLHERRSTRLRQWNAQVMEKAHEPDAAILHVYVNSGLADAAALSDTGLVAAALGRPRLAMDRLRRQAVLPPDLPWWITEFNQIDSDKPAMRGGLPGLMVAHLLMEFLAEPRVECALLYQLTESSGLAALHGRAVAYAGFPGRPAEPGARTAAGAVMRLAADAMAGRPHARALRVEQEPQTGVRDAGESIRYASLRGYVFSGATNDTQALLVNLSADPVELDLRVPGWPAVGGEVLRLPPDQPILGRSDLRVIALEPSSRLSVPGYAVLRLFAAPADRSDSHGE